MSSTARKLILNARNPKLNTKTGRLIADAGKRDWDEFTAEYGAQLVEILAVIGCKRSAAGAEHVNVLQHLMGYLKNHLSGDDKAYRR